MSTYAALLVALCTVPVLLSGLPIAFSLLAACLGYMFLEGMDLSIPGSTIFWFLNKSSLVSIPFFIFAAEILSRSGATDALVNASNLIFGRMRNGLALVTVVAIMVFSAISGSSVATAVAIGRTMIPKLIENGYKKNFSVGLVAASGGLGILIPPSVPLIVYAAVVEISVGDLFISAMVPGFILGALLFSYVFFMGERIRTKENNRLQIKDLNPAKTLLLGFPMFLFPVVVLGGIYGGIFTPTEAAAVSVFLATFLAVTIYKNTDFKSFYDVIVRAGTMASTILIIMGATSVLSYILSYTRIPNDFTEFITSANIDPLLFLLAINLMLLVLGCFLEIISVILVVVPVVLPTLIHLGIDPIHFGIILVINMELAVITPPIGMNLFVVSAISGQSVANVFRGALPFVYVIAFGLLIIVLFPKISTFFIN